MRLINVTSGEHVVGMQRIEEIQDDGVVAEDILEGVVEDIVEDVADGDDVSRHEDESV